MMKKITRQMLEQLVLNEYESFMNTIKEQTIKEIRKRKGMPEEVKGWQFFLE